MDAVDEKLLTASEVAGRLRLSLSGVRRLLVSGKLPGRRRGATGHWLVREADLEAFLVGPEQRGGTVEAARSGDVAAQLRLRAIGYDV